MFNMKVIHSGVRLSLFGTVATIGLLYKPQMIDDGDCGAVGGLKVDNETKYSEKTCPSATLSTTNPTWPDLGSNPGCCSGKPATNLLSYVTACV
jgi:hypothetical protein